MATKLSNIIGAPFANFVLQQLAVRAYNNSSTDRSNQQVLFLANKSAWARLTSSVQITPPPVANQPTNYGTKQTTSTGFNNNSQTKVPYLPSNTNSPISLNEFYRQFNLDTNLYKTGDDLAKNWVLEAGTSVQNGNGINLRQGIGPNGAYGLGGTQELGYRPMPGLTSVTIETTGRLGSLRQATINFKVWNMDQLNVIEALYFRLGYSMLLEWGHTQYFKNSNSSNGVEAATGLFVNNGVYGIGDPFVAGLRKEDVQQRITSKVQQTSGNYDGMLGVVSNFTWSFNQDGGYDCMVRLVGLGAVMDSMRINQVYNLPDGLIQEYKKVQQGLANAAQEAELAALKKEVEELAKKNAPTTTVKLDPLPTDALELLARAKDFGSYDKNKGINDFVADFGAYYYSSFKPPKGNFDYYDPFSQTSGNPSTDAAVQSLYAGLWLAKHPGIPFTKVVAGNNVIFDTALVNTAIDAYPPKVAIGGYSTGPNGQPYTLNSVSSQNTALGKYFDYQTETYLLFNDQNVYNAPLDSVLPKQLLNGSITININDLPTIGKNTKDIYITLAWRVDTSSTNQYFIPTRRLLVNALEAWEALTPSTLALTSITKPKKDDIVVVGTFTTNVDAACSVPDNQPVLKAGALTNPGVTINNGIGTKSVPIVWTITTNNTGFIQGVANANPQNNANTNQTGTGATGDNNGTVNQANAGQVEAPQGFTSALDAMLTLVQAEAQYKAINSNDFVIKVPLQNNNNSKNPGITNKFYSQGSLNGVFDAFDPNSVVQKQIKANATNENAAVDFNLIAYAKKGFNSNLMANPTLYSKVPDVDFNQLCNAYVVNYTLSGPDTYIDARTKPVYITLGYLVAFLNNMCLIYDSTQSEQTINQTADTAKRPYVYIDFNPETNFCFTSQQQLSTDPTVCLIPFNCSDDDYELIFPTDVKTTEFDPDLFYPESENRLSAALYDSGLTFKPKNSGKTGNNQGQTMNILLRIDYLLTTLKSFASNDPHNAVILQSYLEQIMKDVNKCLGDVNLFRIAYRDDTNTIQIQDDQWVPEYSGETGTEDSILNRADFLRKLRNNPILSGELPVFGSGAQGNTLSLTRQFQFKTVMSTKLASMVAISAQANTDSVNSIDHSSLSYLNQHYTDRYKPYVQNPSSPKGSNNDSTNKNLQESNNQKIANIFNLHIINIYSNAKLDPDKIQMAKNYYIERMSHVKSGDPITSAAPFIPADLEMTIDGISGIIMGNGFTIPANRLPISLRETTGDGRSFSKVGFIVTGLTHIIQNNEWLTRFKGQMIKLRTDQQNFTTVSAQPQTIAPTPTITSTGLTGNIIEDAVNFIKSHEQLASTQKLNTTQQNKTDIAYAPSNPSPSLILYPYNLEGNKRPDGSFRLTIGWGTYDTYRTGVKANQPILPTDTITAQQAEDNLRTEIAGLYKTLVADATSKGITLTNGQAVALLDIGYNTGEVTNNPLYQSLISKTNPNLNAITSFRVGTQFKGALVDRRTEEYNKFIA